MVLLVVVVSPGLTSIYIIMYLHSCTPSLPTFHSVFLRFGIRKLCIVLLSISPSPSLLWLSEPRTLTVILLAPLTHIHAQYLLRTVRAHVDMYRTVHTRTVRTRTKYSTRPGCSGCRTVSLTLTLTPSHTPTHTQRESERERERKREREGERE